MEKEVVITDNQDIIDCIHHYEVNGEYKSTISEQTLYGVQVYLDSNDVSKIEVYEEIFSELGYSDEEIAAIGAEEICYTMENSSEITVSEQYVRVDEDGNREVISKEECLSEAEASNEAREVEVQVALERGSIVTAAASNDASNTGTDSTGYMKITTQSTYITPSTANNNEKGWYTFSATYTWLSNPSQSYTDAISLYAQGCAWAQGSTDMYSSMSYTSTTVSGGTTTIKNVKSEKYSTDRQIQSDGLYYTYSIPASYLDASIGLYIGYSNLVLYVRAKARVSNYTSAYAFNVFSRYEHLTKSCNVSAAFSWKVGNNAPGVTVTATVGNSHTYYTSYNYTNYKP